MESVALNYFQGLSFLAKKVVEDGSSFMTKYGEEWREMTLEEREKILNGHFIPQYIQNKYSDKTDDSNEFFPVLKIACGEKIMVDFENEEGWTWKDEHSGPFSWKSHSQQDLMLDCDEGEKNRQVQKKASRNSRTPERPIDNNGLFFKPEKSIWESPFLAFDKQQSGVNPVGDKFESTASEMIVKEVPVVSQLVANGKMSKQPLISHGDEEDEAHCKEQHNSKRSEDDRSSSPSPVHKMKGFAPLPTESPEHAPVKNSSLKKKNLPNNQQLPKKIWKSSGDSEAEEELVINMSGRSMSPSEEHLSGHISPVFVADNGESTTVDKSSWLPMSLESNVISQNKVPSENSSAEVSSNVAKSGFDFLDNW